jgi:hypothetical protein
VELGVKRLFWMIYVVPECNPMYSYNKGQRKTGHTHRGQRNMKSSKRDLKMIASKPGMMW